MKSPSEQAYADAELAAPADDLLNSPHRKPVRNKQNWRAWLLHIVKAAVAAGLLWMLIRTIRVAALEEAVAGAQFYWILFAFLLMPVNLWLQTFRWHTAIHREMPYVTVKRVAASFFGGMTLGIITPGRVGEIGRVFLLNPPSRVRLAGLHVLDKMYFMAALGFFGPALLYHMPGFSGYLSPTWQIVLLIVTSILPLGYLLFVISPRPLRALLMFVQRVAKLKGTAADLLHALDRVTPADFRLMALLTVGQFGVILTQFYFISHAFQIVKWGVAAHTYATSLFVKTLLPISLGDLGVSEWAAVSFYQRYGIADTTAFSSSLLIFGMNILLPALVGIIFLQRVKPQSLFGQMTRRFRGKQ